MSWKANPTATENDAGAGQQVEVPAEIVALQATSSLNTRPPRRVRERPKGYDHQMIRNRSARTALAALALLAVPFAGACSDEDGDGATTDEEIQDVREGTNDAEKEIEEEIDGQQEGDNQDNEDNG